MTFEERDKLHWGKPSVPAQKHETLADEADKQGADPVPSAQASGKPSGRATDSGLPTTSGGKANSPVTCGNSFQKAKQALGFGERGRAVGRPEHSAHDAPDEPN